MPLFPLLCSFSSSWLCLPTLVRPVPQVFLRIPQNADSKFDLTSQNMQEHTEQSGSIMRVKCLFWLCTVAHCIHNGPVTMGFNDFKLYGCLRLLISKVGGQCIPFYAQPPSFIVQQDNDPKLTNSQIDQVSHVTSIPLIRCFNTEDQTEWKKHRSTEDTKCLPVTNWKKILT